MNFLNDFIPYPPFAVKSINHIPVLMLFLIIFPNLINVFAVFWVFDSCNLRAVVQWVRQTNREREWMGKAVKNILFSGWLKFIPLSLLSSHTLPLFLFFFQEQSFENLLGRHIQLKDDHGDDWPSFQETHLILSYRVAVDDNTNKERHENNSRFLFSPNFLPVF